MTVGRSSTFFDNGFFCFLVRAAQGIIWYTVLTWTNYVYKKETPPLVATGINSDAFLSLSLLPTLLSSYIFSLIFFPALIIIMNDVLFASRWRPTSLLFSFGSQTLKKISFFFLPHSLIKLMYFLPAFLRFFLPLRKEKTEKKKITATGFVVVNTI